MTDPERLRAGEADAFESSLLLSARADAGSSHAKMRALSAFAVGAGAGLAGSAAAASQPAQLGAAVIVKWLAMGALAGFGTAGALYAGRGFVAQPTHAQVTPALATSHSVPAPVRPASRLEPSATPPAAASPPVPHPNSPVVSLAATPAPVASSARASVVEQTADTSLLEQVRLLERVRSELSRAEPSAALRALDEYGERFPKGPLLPEATVLRVEALLMRGERTRAEAVSAAFIRAWPRGPHADRLRSLLAKGETPGQDRKK